MSYVVLARKYRPRSFAQMVGQEHVVQALTNALRQQRLHHAYLFTGTRGIGKTTVSRILAKSLNCTGADGQGGITDEPCGVCQACTEIDADRYIDYIELDAASNRGIDEVRDLLERAAYKPSVGRFKVFMIDEAHQLTKESFNALLKTLEEPPEYLKFVLATTDPQKMLPTVLSRCLQFNLRPMAPETVLQHLRHVLDAEQVASDDGALRLLSRAARGSMRDALSLTDQAIAYGGGRLDEGVVRTMLGTVDRSHANRLVQALAARDGAALLQGVDALRSMGLSASGTLEEIATLLQQMAVEQAVPGTLDDTDPDTAAVRELAAALPPDETQLLYSIVLNGRAELNLVSDEYAGLTMVLLRLLAFPPQQERPAEPRGAMAASRAAPAPAPAEPRADGVAAMPAGRASSVPPAPSASPAAASPLQMGGAARQVVQPRPAGFASSRPTPTTELRPGSGAAPGAKETGAERPESNVRSTSSERAPVAPVSVNERPAPAFRNAPRSAEPPPWLDEPPPMDEMSAGGDAVVMERPRVAPPAPAAVEAPPREIAPAATPAAPSAPVVDDRSWEVQRTELGDRWAAVVAQLNERGSVVALVRELAQQAELVRVEQDTWRLRVERESLRAQPLRDKLQTALAGVVQPAPVLEIEAGVAQDSPARREVEQRERRQREAEQIIRNDPVVRDLMAQFRTARIVPGSIKPV